MAEQNESGCEILKTKIRKRLSYLRGNSTDVKESSVYISKKEKFTPKKYRKE
jgi:hypothetical protein